MSNKAASPAPCASDCSSSLPPRIVCLCGSTKFKSAFEIAAAEETLCGNIVLTVHVFSHHDNLDLREDTLADLKRLHLAKIKMADEVLILNVGGYVGDGLQAELEYAARLGIPVRWLE
ncbi:MAG TPA: hypothetical protein DDZ51_03270 [Planctomycetaceae bacterium]|nr:hypothetical protein [Planctomycetaceae bacterium]